MSSVSHFIFIHLFALTQHSNGHYISNVYFLCLAVEKDANLTWVFITAPVVAVVLLLAGLYFMTGIQKAHELEEQVKEERARGLTPTWGKKVNVEI